MHTVKFWQWINNAPVKLKLRQGQILTHCARGLTDEGFSATAHIWALDGDIVTLEYINEGRDCDGRFAYYSARYFTPQDPTVEDGGIAYPVWQNIGSSMRDETAERAGY